MRNLLNLSRLEHPILRTVIIVLFIALCSFTSPVAWEVRKSKGQKESQFVIPKLNKEAHWYQRPHKRLNRYDWTLAKIARKAEKLRYLKKSFNDLKKVSLQIDLATNDAKLPHFAHKNRYDSLIPFDLTRSGRELDNFYINANDVHTSVQDYIVTQGPLDHTVADFWKVILHKKAQTIVTLVMAQEDGKDKCLGYWHKAFRPVTVEGWHIKLASEKVTAVSELISSHQIVVRKFVAKRGHDKRVIKQIHYENWPDCKTPELELFLNLLDQVDEATSNHHAPIAVHCSAGIGRSGTFVAAHSLRKELRLRMSQKKKKPIRINIPKALFQLRCQRMALVGNPRQYQVIYQALAREYLPRKSPIIFI